MYRLDIWCHKDLSKIIEFLTWGLSLFSEYGEPEEDYIHCVVSAEVDDLDAVNLIDDLMHNLLSYGVRLKDLGIWWKLDSNSEEVI